MHIQALMNCISNLEGEPKDLIMFMIQSFLEEVTDPESFSRDIVKNVSINELLTIIANDSNDYLSDMLLTCAVEFCVTNSYQLYDKEWNCIDHIIAHQKKNLNAEDVKYLKALNNSYMSIYKVINVFPGEYVTLQDKIEKTAPIITVADKSLSNSATKGVYIGVRIIDMNTKTTPKQYELSSSTLVLPEPTIKNCIKGIRNITKMMLNPIAMMLFGEGQKIAKTQQNKLLIKKMWVKEIAEIVYDYHQNWEEYHELLDMDGNPWCPSVVEFKLNAPITKVRTALSAIKELITDPSSEKKDCWIWCAEEYAELNQKTIRKHLPKMSKEIERPIFNDQFIQNEYDGRAYRVYATIKLTKDKLIIELSSKQRANIVQDKFSEELGNLVSAPFIYSER